MATPGWDTTPAPAENVSLADAGHVDSDAWEPDSSAIATDGFSHENISKHAASNELESDGYGNDGCRVCGSDAHFARDCPDKPHNNGACFNCGETGHTKADCNNERVEHEFTGNCHICNEKGHRAAICPKKPPSVCKLCKREGHVASDCDMSRMESMFSALSIPQVPVEDAWTALEEADNKKDLEDIKKAVFMYAKAYPKLTFEELEEAFRGRGMKTYLIAKAQELSDAFTIVNLQGETGQEFVVSFQFSTQPKRAKFAEGWPSSSDENLQRLPKAGFVMDSLIPKCTNCSEFGHTRLECEQEKNDASRNAIACANCNEEGHRARDCTKERKSDKRSCKNCGSEEHLVKECPEPRTDMECKSCGETGHFARDCPSREPEVCRNCGEEGHRAKDCSNERVVTCRNCDQKGHISKECPEPRNMAKVQCRNCDEFGHTSRDCPKPTDWSRVECSSCHEKGHSYKRCPKPPTAITGDNGGWDEEASKSLQGEKGCGDNGWSANAGAFSEGAWGAGNGHSAEHATYNGW